MIERNMQEQCRKHIGSHMLLETTDGRTIDGIIESTDDQGVTMMVAEEMNSVDREYIFTGDDDDDYRRRPRFRRFRRRRFPFPFIRRIFYYPYYYPYYPYYYPPGYAPPYVYPYTY
ncbi:hypothetical protein [Fictibacillus arsenicus]|uniref:Uncharacterized protein n=1 Tax=Fictibacillus arsenicus TaxID=255247 RepID=A0A1V3G7X6_9BACL|nr:hypothetical protein [Fictibacillus arsenicus]OOE12534.1 hypothetical protein UN64_10675 [Fictibacillus arsenicus]